MSTEVKKYEITILGESYTLLSDQDEGHIQSASQKVDEIMDEISQKAPHIDQKRVAVLTALKIASMLVANEDELGDLKNKSQNLLDYLDRELSASSLV